MKEVVKVLDLFAGLRGWSDPWKAAGHRVFTIDDDPRFDVHAWLDLTTDPTDVADIIRRSFGRPDVILASPPCTSFSMMSVGTHWTNAGEPKTFTATVGRALVLNAVTLAQILKPDLFIMENPRARLRSLPWFPEGLERRTVWYCHYGEQRAKPTDLWSPDWRGIVLYDGCHNNRGTHPADCCCRDHHAAPRGSRTGTQGADPIVSAKIPAELSDHIRRQWEGTR